MALVRYNRNYTVQSVPRQPARRNPGALPDAAGAFLRGTSGIHEGDMAVGRALLASNEARTKRELARAADAGRHWQEAGRIVAAAGKGLGEIADSYQRAQARKVASEIDGLEAFTEAYMIENADSIYNAPWKEKDGKTVGGPSVRFREVVEALENTKEWTNASDAAKKGAEARVKARLMVYKAKAERKQDEARRAVWQERADAKDREDGAAVASFFGIEDNAAGTFDNKVGIAVESRKNAAMVRLGALVPELQPDGTLNFTPRRELTPEEKSAIDEDGKSLVRQFRTERLKHWFAQLEDPDTDADVLKDAIDGEIKETNYPSDADRLAIERARDAAVAKRDAAIAQGMSDAVAAITLDPAASPDPAAAFKAARQKAQGIASPALRAKVLDGIDKADADIQFNGFLDAVDAAAPGEELPRTDVFLGENSAWFASAMLDAERLPSPDARDRAVSWLLSGRATVEKAENQAAEEQAQKKATELLSRVVTGYGYNANGDRVPLSPSERADAFRAVYPRLTPTLRREYGEAIRKVALSGATVSLADIDEIGRAAGVENLSAFFAPPQPGKDPSLDKEKLNKDGTVTIDPAGLGNRFSMPADAMMEMVEAIRQYKAAVAAAGNKAGVHDPAQVWASVLADKSAYKGYCEAAHRRAVAQALAEYAAAYPAVLMPPSEDEQR